MSFSALLHEKRPFDAHYNLPFNIAAHIEFVVAVSKL